MDVHFLASHNFEKLLMLLSRQGELHAPLRGTDGLVRFAALTPGVLPDLAAVRTMLPPKKYLLHPCETLLTYQTDTGYREPSIIKQPMILMGLHPCDLAGINYLDRLFLCESPDPLYAARRSALTLIGTSCTADDLCSCHLASSPLKAGFDLFLQCLEDGFAVTGASLRGDELLGLLAEVLEERDLALPDDTRSFFGQSIEPTSRSVPDSALPGWQELASHCLGCGACSICCPTCSCFDVLECGGLDGSSAERVRRWDNCLFKSHAEVAGGVSFRKERAERFRYRYRHKYHGYGPLQGVPGCTGCGRCRAACPAGLDLRPLAENLEGGNS